MQTYTNLDGVECVLIVSQDGSMWSGLKSVYDAQEANSDYQAYLATLPSNSSTPQADIADDIKKALNA